MGNVVTFESKIPAKRPVIYATPEAGLIRNSRWVMYEGKVGIVTDMKEDGSAIFNAVDEEGVTFLKVPVAFTDLVQATWEQMPESRRPSKEAAAELGYAISSQPA